MFYFSAGISNKVDGVNAQSIKLICDSGNMYILTIHETNKRTEDHKTIHYSLYDGNRFVFNSDNVTVPLHWSTFGDNTHRAVLDAITIRPGDTDSKLFDDYGTPQYNFINSIDAEDMRCYAFDLEN